MQAQPFPKTAIKYIVKECLIPYKWTFLICLLFVLAEKSVFNLLGWLFAKMVDGVKQGATPENLHNLLWIFAAVFICNVINIFLPKQNNIYRQKYFYFPLQRRIYGRALSYIFGHSVNYIVNKQTGTLLTKTNQIKSLQPIFSVIIAQFWGIFCDIGVKIILLTVINPRLGQLFLICVAVVTLVNYYANQTANHLNKMQSKSEALYTGWLVDVIANIRLVKQFNRLEYEKKRLSTLLQQYIKIKAKTMLVWFSSYTGMCCFIYLCSLFMLIYAIYLWSESLITVGDIVFVLLTLSGGFMWLMELCTDFRRLANSLSYVQAGLEPFTTPHEITDNPNAKPLKVKKAEIEFKNICFAYPEQNRIFDGFNLKIKSGEKVGIVGLSGSGKSTLINLLQRAYDIQSGQILIDGQDIKNVTQSSLHQNLAIIPQDTSLFHRTVSQNVSYGRLHAKQSDIEKAAQRAYADNFIKQLPKGYQTKVGEKGVKLSGGQRQRVAIARAILKNSPILILDEATSALDSQAEKYIQKGMKNLMKNKTVIAIAHRLSTLKEMDRIIVLDKGKIAEQGTIKDLLASSGKFQHFWQIQN